VSEPWGRARRSPSSSVEVEPEPWGRVRRRPSSEVEAVSEPWVGRDGDRLPRLRLCPSPGVGQALLSASLCRVAQQSERRRRRCFLVRSVSGAAK
jgi:hypothetical protein